MEPWYRKINGFSVWIYLGLAVVLSLSIYLASTPLGSGLIGELVKVPAVGALLGIVVLLIRDEAAFGRQLELKRQDEYFTVSVASHMAQKAFDKYAQFCEEYVERVIKAMGELLTRGATKEACQIAADLELIRRKHAPWVATNVAEELMAFERKIYILGVEAEYWDKGQPAGREEKYDSIQRAWMEILGLKPSGGQEKKSQEGNRIIQYLQDVLGITELTTLRVDIIKKAHHRTGSA